MATNISVGDTMFKFKNKGKKLNNLNNELEDLEVLDDDNVENKSKINRLIFLIKKIFSNKVSTAITIIILLVGILVLLQTNNSSLSSTFYAVLSRVGLYSNTKKEVTISSSSLDDDGAWEVTKSATITGQNTAQISIKVDSTKKIIGNTKKDVIFVVDTSGTMADEGKLDTIKADLREVVKYILDKGTGGVNIVPFDSTSTLPLGTTFSHSIKEIYEEIDKLTPKGFTNYNAALKNVDKIMQNYNKVSDTDIITVFLTDGYPSADTPNQTTTYKELKEKYPYLLINGIQYDLGSEVAEELKEISDKQWVADNDTIYNILFEASISPAVYETFKLEDYIDTTYYTLNSKDDITVSNGNVSVSGNKITWDLSNILISGLSSEMTINLTVKDSYKDSDVDMRTNTLLKVVSKLPSESTITKNLNDSPILKMKYDVIYNSNLPKGAECSAPTDSTSKSYKVFDTVQIESNELVCGGYLFKGWVIDSEDDDDIQMINDEYFIMPEHDVTIRGTWTKHSITKKMSGTIHTKTTLYKTIAERSKTDSNILEYTGSDHFDSMNTKLSTQKIYYYNNVNNTTNDDTNNNNVIFGGFCWQIVRTTDTGGVKLIYNGEPYNGTCENNRSNHVGFDYTIPSSSSGGGKYSSAVGSIEKLSYNYAYGTSYEYDNVNEVFKVSGTVTNLTWSDDTASSIIGKYTCKQIDSSDTCETLYYVVEAINGLSAYVYRIDDNIPYYQIGNLQYNNNYNSVADVGYKYNTRYEAQTKYLGVSSLILTNDTIDETWQFASKNNVNWDDQSKKWSFTSSSTIQSTNYKDLVGKYTFKSPTASYSSDTVYYIVDAKETHLYAIPLTKGVFEDNWNYNITYGDSYIYNADDDTYTLIGASEADTTFSRFTYHDNYQRLIGKYACINYDFTENKCSDLRDVYYANSTNVFYSRDFDNYKTSNDKVIYKFSNSVTYDSTSNKYKLVNPIDIEFYNSSDLDSLSGAHYTCWNNSFECENVSYVYYIDEINNPNIYPTYYINLSNGTKVDEALKEMLSSDDVNSKNSTIKNVVDAWYKRYMTDYTSYLEDAVFCNDRTITSYGGWDADNGSVRHDNYLNFKLDTSMQTTHSLACNNVTDQFSTSNPKALLTYPVGLLTGDEFYLANTKNRDESTAFMTGFRYWFMTPFQYNWAEAKLNGAIGTFVSFNEFGIRPVVSLLPDTEYSSGDGTAKNPFIVEIN
jgi:Mg-chelatase subunit ChlD